MIDELTALTSLHFNWADTPDHVWRDSPFHVDGLHTEVLTMLDGGIREAAGSEGPSPIGLVLQGQKGIGKTHLLGLVRRRTHQMGGYFFLADLTTGDAFWENTLESLRSGLYRADDSGDSQLSSFLRRVCQRGGVGAATEQIVTGKGLARKHVDAFVVGLRELDRQVAQECADVARALVLYASLDSATSEVGESYLGRYEENKRGERRKWGIGPRERSPLVLVRDIVRLLALTGPSVIAVDQLDTLIARSVQRTQDTGDSGGEERLLAQIADGLMELREVTRRTLTVLACLPNTWAQIKRKAVDSVPDRFRETRSLGRITDAGLAMALVEKRLGVSYRAMNFVPPHPTWPVAASAFDREWEERTPRDLWKRVGAHIDWCVRTAQVRELSTFDDGPLPMLPVQPPVKPDRFHDLDTSFAEYRASADLSVLLAPGSEDRIMPELLSAALRSWINEVGDDNLEWAPERPDRDSNALHAWLTHTVDEASDLEERWAFRTIFAAHHLAVLHRLRKALTAAGARQGADNRHLILIRNTNFSPGEKTQEELARFRQAGGQERRMSEADARTFWALEKMLAEGGTELLEWLVERRPASRSELLSSVLPETPDARRVDDSRPPPPPSGSAELTLGTDIATGKPVTIELAALRKHAAVFAGSGSGKTVLIRRVIEECALRGVSTIVLDPNNDLARLGDAWPEPPDGWQPGDAALAQRYLADTDVVIWTPGRAAGRPLAFQALPDFAGVLDDEDEFGAAVDVAVASLAPQARLTGSTVKADIGLAVLRQAVVHHARTGSRSLPGLIEVLADLPDNVSTLNDGHRIAADLAEVLKAAMINDPLLAGDATTIDPGLLLTPSAGKRARVSVISFVGLPGEEQRQNFVNQLQMELFAWIKRHPAGDRPLGGLFVMDEAQTLAASGTLTASTRSTIVLASQARKYGLGLLFATQAPKGLHNQVVGNAMTQFFGRLNSPAQIAAANELARAKASAVEDISRLERAQFYVAGEAFGFHKIATPLCLSYHPPSPLRLEEVLDRARISRAC
ncbi:MAG TPA: DUF87 domain-containing protein [Pseudonocardiaceae bacterium]|jgi:hypothetical protein|nr:DUF87 domain-containing protein [Pseudonocardiaceae bacterium]